MKKKIAKRAAGIMLAAAMVVSSSLNVTAGSAATVLSSNSVVGQSTFDEGVGLPWHTCQTNPATQTFNISEGTYNVTIENPGGSSRGGDDRWDLQLRHRGISIQSGHTYTVKFDVNSSNEGNLCAKIGNLKGDVELWRNAMGLVDTTYPELQNTGNTYQLLAIKKGDNHFECKFTANQTLEVAEWAFHYGGSGQYTPSDCFPIGTTLKFDNLILECETCKEQNKDTCLWDTTKEMGYVTPRSDVRINQVGYYTNLTKVASYATDEQIAPVTFVVKDSSGKEVFSGTGIDKGYDEASGEYVQLLDFTDFQQAGKNYYIEVSDTTNIQTNKYTQDSYEMYKSHSFDIVDPASGSVYEGVLTNALNYYYQNRSGVAIEEAYITSGDKSALAHQAGHANDTAAVQSAWVKSYASDGSDCDTGYTIDCTGGWYDAGDHGKYVVNGGISVWTLQNMYEMSKLSGTESKWNDGATMSIPEQTNGDPDILDEARVELEWMFKMIVQSKDPYWGDKAGLVYHKMHDHKWTGLGVKAWDYASEWGTIRIVKPPTLAATLNVAATAAQAARLWKGIDDDFANECLENAKLTYEAAKANYSEYSKDNPLYAPLDQAIGGGGYGDTYVGDDFYWAACELYATTGDATYYNDLKEYKNPNDTTGNDKAFSLTTSLGGGENSGSFSSFNWGCTAGLGTLTLYLNEDKLDDSAKTSVESAIVSAADEYIAQENAEGMGIPYRGTTFQDAINIGAGIDVTGYEWGSNSFVVNNAMVMAYAYKIKGTNEYMSGVSTALDYVFGRNGLGISYVTGTGDYYTQNPHHRYWAYEIDSSFPKAPAGVMSGGAGSGLQDPYVGGLGYTRGKEAPQKCYVDSAEAWSVNEVTINWNAPFAWVLSFMEDETASAGSAEGKDPSTTEQRTTAASTTEKVTEQTATTEKATEQATTTEQQATVAPTTEATTMEQQATTAPTTEKVTTQAPTTEKVTTQAPTTEKVTTQAPTTEKVTTQAPTTEKVTTQATTTEQQATVAPTTEKQTTEQSTENQTVRVTGVTVDPEAFTLEVDEQKALNAQVTPSNAAVNSVTWESDNKNVATVNNAGVVTAVAPGTAKITVTTVDGNYKATCTITVVKGSVAVESVTFDKDNVSLKVGESDTVTATVAPADADNKTLTWVSSDESVATVNNGVIKAVKEGTAIVTAFTGNGKSVSCTVYVTSKTINVEGVSFDTEACELVEGEEFTLKATVTPASASNQKVTWNSTDSSVASVDANGKVIALKEGTATITAKTEDGNFTASCKITVVSKNTNIPVTGITLTQSTLNLVAGGTGKIEVAVSPANATNKELAWSSSNESVATVDANGNVTAKKAGTAIIFVTAKDGNYTETCNVVVTDSKVSVLGVTLDQTSISLAEGTKTALVATVSPENATDKAVVWTSSDSSVAVVDNYGNVTAVKAGTATITVITSDGAKQATCTVTVTANSILIESIQLNKHETTLTVGQKETLTASVTPSNVTNDQVVWSSSDETIATVSNGVVTAVKTGTAYITAKSLHGSCVDVCKVVVTNSGVAVEKIEITQPEINIEAGKTTQITLKVEPSNATVEDLVYSSSDESVVKVDANGKVTAVGPGTAIITVTTKDGKLTTNSQVTVTGGGTSSSDVVDVTDITLPEEGTTVNMTAGDSKQFNAQVVPVNATNQTLFWASSNTAVVDFANSTVGLAKAKSSGTATITVTSADGKQKASFTIKVEAASTTTPDPGESDGTVAVTGITLSATEVSIAAGRTYKLSATVTPANATNKGVRFISLNKSIATIDDTGMITAKAAGDVVIMVLTEKGEFIQCCEVTVTAEGSEPTNPTVNGSIKLSASQATMIPKQQVQLTATVQNLTNKNVTWSSMNPAVATVDANGTVTAVAAGATTILAKSADGTVSAACKIDVKAAATSTLKYEVTKFTATQKEVCVAGVAKNTVKTVKIPKTVKFYGVTYKVTSIKAKAFKSNKKITKVTIGQNVNKIGKQAFYGCGKVKTMSIKTTKLTSKKVGSKAFSKMKSTIKVTVPKSKKSSYKKLLKSKGIGSKAVIK